MVATEETVASIKLNSSITKATMNSETQMIAGSISRHVQHTHTIVAHTVAIASHTHFITVR
eukprot:CAMPEP_0168338420 /NCGR_PEP_ID=MMETSP0213-20121227/12827_1 /TAXON_ID=151035 /ORGANISM="Euplotes harpa, Strain FSP1.4" /LENGTH=60 /DNA_ID=CAMNT_0008344201 /DNA_START=619 /DNA_END=798 /DNA_ORIENTATION=-